MGNQIKKLETTTKTMNLVSKLALGAAIALKGVESSQLPLEDNFRNLKGKKDPDQDAQCVLDRDDFEPPLGHNPQYVAKCKVHDKADGFMGSITLYDAKFRVESSWYRPSYEVPGAYMNAAFDLGKKSEQVGMTVWLRDTATSWYSLGDHPVSRSGKFVTLNSKVHEIDLKRMYEDEEFDFDLRFYTDYGKHTCQL